MRSAQLGWMPGGRRFSVMSATAVLFAVMACSDSSTGPAKVQGFLAGTAGDAEIGIVVSSTGKSMTLFQLGSPTTQEQIALGTSSTITPVGFSVRGTRAAVPLGNAASVAVIDLQAAAIQKFFTFASGNATGSAFSDDTTIFAANTSLGKAGRFTVGQTNTAITSLVDVAPAPTAIAVASGKVFVVSSNLDNNYAPIGPGIITAIDPKTMQVLGTVQSGGTNSTDIAVGSDGLLYVVNTGNYVAQGSVTIINPATLAVVQTVSNMGVGAGAISIDANGLAYVTGFYSATVVWNTGTRTFVRSTDNPVCAKLTSGACRSAFAATANHSGKVYQAFLGSAAQSLAPYIFVFNPGTFTLADSISVGAGPAAISIRSF